MNFWVQEWLADNVNSDPLDDDMCFGEIHFIVHLLLVQRSTVCFEF